MATIQDLVDALARDQSLFEQFKDAKNADEWLRSKAYPVVAEVVAFLQTLNWDQLKAMVEAREGMETANVPTQFRLQMV